eukprot:4618322-Prymnesium_polylepis.1
MAFLVEASADAVATFLAEPKSWVSLMAMAEETPIELIGATGDFKLTKPNEDVIRTNTWGGTAREPTHGEGPRL